MMWWLVSVAWATNVNICGQYDLDYDDMDASIGDDYYITPGAYPAYGARVQVECVTCGVPPTPVVETYLPHAVPTCITVVGLSTSELYRVRLKTRANLQGGNEVTVRDTKFASGGKLYSTSWQSFQVPASGTGTATITAPALVQWHAAAAAGWSVLHNNGDPSSGGVPAYTYKVLMTTPPECNDSQGISPFACQLDGFVWLGDANLGAAFKKWLVAHEMGHLVAYHETGGAQDYWDYTADPEDCYTSEATGSSHEFNSREFHSAAFVEGLGNLYGAAAFNSLADASCFFQSNNGDIDWNNDRTTVDNDDIVDCNNGPMVGIDADDYLGDECTAGQLTDRATEYDYTRMLWDLAQQDGMPIADMFVALDLALFNDWADESPGTGEWEPTTGLLFGAWLAGWQQEWEDRAAEHGVDR